MPESAGGRQVVPPSFKNAIVVLYYSSLCALHIEMISFQRKVRDEGVSTCGGLTDGLGRCALGTTHGAVDVIFHTVLFGDDPLLTT